jgi:hypothetical protein
VLAPNGGNDELLYSMDWGSILSHRWASKMRSLVSSTPWTAIPAPIPSHLPRQQIDPLDRTARLRTCRVRTLTQAAAPSNVVTESASARTATYRRTMQRSKKGSVAGEQTVRGTRVGADGDR